MSARYRSFLDILLAALIGLSLGEIVPVAQASGAEWRAEEAPQYDRLFQQKNGWIGAVVKNFQMPHISHHGI